MLVSRYNGRMATRGNSEGGGGRYVAMVVHGTMEGAAMVLNGKDEDRVR